MARADCPAACLTVALAGNPNVGKSTVFNALTGMHQHTGNWPGKTVSNARGRCRSRRNCYELVDLPGTYSLLARSAEEETARNFLCFDRPDAVVVVCDATCLERNLNLVLQIMELSSRVVVCVNLLDEARRKGVRLDLEALSHCLGVPVVGVVARKKRSLERLLETLDRMMEESLPSVEPLRLTYGKAVEESLALLTPVLEKRLAGRSVARWLALRLLEENRPLLKEAEQRLEWCPERDPEAVEAVENAVSVLERGGVERFALQDRIVSRLVLAADRISRETVSDRTLGYDAGDRRLDRLLTGRWTGLPVMLALLALLLWLTVVGANAISGWLAEGLFWVQGQLTRLFAALHAPGWLHGALVLGAYRVLAWVVSVMLPPMAIFFPLFTLLEDAGYLPRVAYNLDRPFQSCRACGKQALTMCMGLGCNAVGVTGCRIIDSPRERLLAILTNALTPCNGRIPTLTALLSLYFSGGSSAVAALLLTGLLILSVALTLGMTRLLSGTVLRGTPSAFTLELPPYRPPQVGRVLVRSVLDRTVFVLGRAAAVAAPAGLLLWVLANASWGGSSLLARCAEALEPFAGIFGLNGPILLAFVLGFPANEIVLPIAAMIHLSGGVLAETGSLQELGGLLQSHGWTWVTAGSTILFTLLHWPCSTTLLTIRRETGSLKWTMAALLLPTALGLLACFLFAGAARLLL